MTERTALAQSRTSGREFLRAAVVIAFITLAAHGLALFDGVILDDYWHQKGLREHGWSFREILRTLNITPGDFQHLWWQTKDVCWDYLRPFFILCMKVVYVVIGRSNPMSLHAFSIILHYASALMIWRLCRLLTQNTTWSLLGSLLFVIYPHATVTVAWPSSQNVVLQTTLLLGALLCYLRASNLHVSPLKDSEAGSENSDVVPLAKKPLVAAAILWLLAIFTRENAILLPAILLSFDCAFGGWRHVRARLGLYVAMGLIGGLFLLWREWMHVHPLPDVYCRRPDGNGPEYIAWLAAKYLHYICVSVWPAPMSIGPTGRYNPWASALGDCIFMISLVAGLAIVYHRATRGMRGRWIWPLWIGLFVLPVTAVVATPHSGYMSGVGFAIGMAVACAGCWPTYGAREPLVLHSRLVRRVTAAVVTILFLGMAFMAPVGRLQWRAFAAAEAAVPEWVMVSPPPREVRDVFFINPPFAAIYLKPNLVARLGPWFEDVKVHVLTYAPDGFAMEHPSIIERTGDRSFTVEVKDRAYFSRLLGRFLLEGFRGKELFQTGQEIKGAHFDAKIVHADAEGVWKLEFVFPRPLSDPRYCFYFGSRRCSAARIRFPSLEPSRKVDQPATPTAEEITGLEGMLPQAIRDLAQLQFCADLLAAGHTDAAKPLFNIAMFSSDSHLADNAKAALLPVVRHMTVALGSPFAPAGDSEPANKYWESVRGTPQPWVIRADARPFSPEQWTEVREWWEMYVDDRSLSEIWLRRHDFHHLLHLRSELDWDRWIASLAIRTDLYLSGAPFDNPRGRY